MSSAARRARVVARKVHRRHDENFPVLVALLPRAVHDDMRAVYAFCRRTDDLGDEGDPFAREEQLDRWSDDLERCFSGAAQDPVLQALSSTIARKNLDPDLFRRLVEANRMDQRQNRWATFDDLVRYCEHSATPVGRMVLGVLGYNDAWRAGLSDATCVGLQLANFWQDIRRDLDDRGRIYLPADDMDRFGVGERDLGRPPASAAVRELVRFEVDRARDYLVRGAPLASLVPRRAGLYLRMFSAGGLAICDAIEHRDYDTITSRPAPGRIGRARLVSGVLGHAVRGGT